MTKIRSHVIDNGNRFWAETSEGLAALTVDVTHDAYSFTIYDGWNEPVGTVSRPRADRKDGHNGFWYVFDTTGHAIRTNAIGPLTCLRSFAIWAGI